MANNWLPTKIAGNLHLLRAMALLLLSASPAWAVQGHGGIEGLVVHQLGHLLFIAGIIALLYYIKRNRLTRPGWGHFTLFFWFLLAWNGLAFASHWLHERVNHDHLIHENDRLIGVTITNFTDLLFYISSFDHLLLVPAFFLLLLVLTRWEDEK